MAATGHVREQLQAIVTDLARSVLSTALVVALVSRVHDIFEPRMAAAPYASELRDHLRDWRQSWIDYICRFASETGEVREPHPALSLEDHHMRTNTAPQADDAAGAEWLNRYCRVVYMQPGGDLLLSSAAGARFQLVPDEIAEFEGSRGRCKCYAARAVDASGPMNTSEAVGYAAFFGQAAGGQAVKQTLLQTCWYHKHLRFYRVFSIFNSATCTYVNVPDEMAIVASPQDWSRIDDLAQGLACRGPTNIFQSVIRRLGAARQWKATGIRSQADLVAELTRRLDEYREKCVAQERGEQ